MSTKEYPSVEYVRQCLRYEDGKLFWLQRPREHFVTERAWKTWNARFSGKEAGTFEESDEPSGRRWKVTLDWRRFYRYHVVWVLLKGEWQLRIDHRNRSSLDDRIDNLRVSTQAQNLSNTSLRSNNKSGFKGVSRDNARGCWQASIQVHGQSIGLGRFGTPEEAHAAYMRAAERYFGEFASDGT